MNLIVSPLAMSCVYQLNQAGYDAHLVGGCVRDLLLGLPPSDYDICTNALPEEITAVFSRERTILTGMQHGTVTVLKNGQPFEITTYRIESGYSDGRHPDSVTFTKNLTDDLSRRDFTMNAIAYHPSEGLTDPFGGVDDMNHKLIRCVGDPLLRFEEDALRMLRAIRFEACLGFSLDSTVVAAISLKADRIQHVSSERIYDELVKILLSERATGGVMRLLSLFGNGLLWEICPTSAGVRLLDQVSPVLPLRFAALLMNTSGAAEFLQSLRAPNNIIKAVETILAAAEAKFPYTSVGARQLCHMAEDNALLAAELIDLSDTKRTKKSLKSLVKLTYQRKEPYRLSDLKVNGTDLQNAGIAEGKEIGQVLEQLMELVMENPRKNQKEYLLSEAQKIHSVS